MTIGAREDGFHASATARSPSSGDPGESPLLSGMVVSADAREGGGGVGSPQEVLHRLSAARLLVSCVHRTDQN